jgi:hypothetical protein
VGVYVTGEATRGLADLEAKERDRCANFASKAVDIPVVAYNGGEPPIDKVRFVNALAED